MTLSRGYSAILAGTLALGGARVPAPAREQFQAAADSVPCRIVWDGATSGGDTQTAHAEVQLTRNAPQADGSFIMFGAGDATVTYHSGLAGARVTAGSPFTAKLEVTLSSDDGKTATVDIDLAPNEGDHTIVVDPGGFTYSVEASMPPSVTLPLKDGASVPYSEFHGSGAHRAGRTGTITLQYCP